MRVDTLDSGGHRHRLWIDVWAKYNTPHTRAIEFWAKPRTRAVQLMKIAVEVMVWSLRHSVQVRQGIC